MNKTREQHQAEILYLVENFRAKCFAFGWATKAWRVNHGVCERSAMLSAADRRGEAQRLLHEKVEEILEVKRPPTYSDAQVIEAVNEAYDRYAKVASEAFASSMAAARACAQEMEGLAEVRASVEELRATVDQMWAYHPHVKHDVEYRRAQYVQGGQTSDGSTTPQIAALNEQQRLSMQQEAEAKAVGAPELFLGDEVVVPLAELTNPQDIGNEISPVSWAGQKL